MELKIQVSYLIFIMAIILYDWEYIYAQQDDIQITIIPN